MFGFGAPKPQIAAQQVQASPSPLTPTVPTPSPLPPMAPRTLPPMARPTLPPMSPQHAAQAPMPAAKRKYRFGASAWLSDDGHPQIIYIAENAPCIGWGIRLGDVIIEMNGEIMDDIRLIDREIAAMSWGSPVSLTVIRNGTRMIINGHIGI